MFIGLLSVKPLGFRIIKMAFTPKRTLSTNVFKTYYNKILTTNKLLNIHNDRSDPIPEMVNQGL